MRGSWKHNKRFVGVLRCDKELGSVLACFNKRATKTVSLRDGNLSFILLTHLCKFIHLEKPIGHDRVACSNAIGLWYWRSPTIEHHEPFNCHW